MTDATGLLRVFWPSDAPREDTQGTIVGWRNSRLDIFVVSILQDVEVETLKPPGIFAFAEMTGIVVSGGTCASGWHLVS